jgi:hypothetical protein
MVQLDVALIDRARKLTTAFNVDRIKEWIFLYEQAVSLHGAQSPGHLAYQEQFERTLREFVDRETLCSARNAMTAYLQELKERCAAAMQHAREALQRAARIEAQCNDLNQRIDAALIDPLLANNRSRGRKNAMRPKRAA